MVERLKSFDLKLMGKLNKLDFTRAVNELHIGFTSEEIESLLKLMNITENYVEIGYFVDQMIKADPSYAHYVQTQGIILLLKN
jgi:hypothetical protein